MNNSKMLYTYIFIFFIFLYTLTMPGHIYNIDTWIRISITKNILEKHTFGFNKEELDHQGIKLEWPTFSKAANGKYYSYHTIGQSLIFIPFYIAGKIIYKFSHSRLSNFQEIDFIEFFCSFTSVLFCAGLVLLATIFCSKLGYKKKTCVAVAFLFGLTTIIWPYSRESYNSVEEAFFGLASCLLLFDDNERGILKTRYILSGLFFGFAFLTKLTAALILPSLLFLISQTVLDKKNSKNSISLAKGAGRKLLFFSLGFTPLLGLFLFYNYLRYGSIFISGYGAKVTLSPLISFKNIPTGFLMLFLLPNYSFFLYNPILLYNFATIKDFISNHKKVAFSFLLIVFLYIIFYSSFRDAYGMWTYGPRHLFPIVPWGAIFLAPALSKWKTITRYNKIIFSSLMGISLILQIPAVSVSHLRFLFEQFGYRKINKTDILWDIKYSPQKEQFINFLKAISNMKNKKSYSFKVDKYADVKELLDKSITLNVINWWWIFLHFKGARLVFFIPFILGAAIIFSLLKIIKEINTQ